MVTGENIESAVREVYHAYWDAYIKGDVHTLASFLDDEYSQVGSAESEVFFNKKDAVQFVVSTIGQVAGKVDMRNRSIKIVHLPGGILVNELADLYFLSENEWAFYAKFRASTFLQQKNGEWKIIHQHSSMPDLRTSEGENIAIEKISLENLELRDAIKRGTIELQQKNHELELETALEKVRAVALGMRKGDDLMDICEVIFAELIKLGWTGLRNAMINIYDDTKATFLNYDYSPAAGKTVTPFGYDSNPIIKKQVGQLRSSKDAFSEIVIAGKELEEFRAFRISNGEADDPRFNDVSAVTYFFYSTGIGAIGLSSFNAITVENREIMKRFRNVFDLSYRRYMDIAQAEAQAREAMIEAALERVRSKAMAMHSSQDLNDTVAVFYRQLELFEITPRRCGVGIVDKASREAELSTMNSAESGDSIVVIGNLKMEGHPVLIGIFDHWLTQEEYHPVLRGNEIKEYYKLVRPQIAFPDYPNDHVQFGNYFYFTEGAVFAWTDKALTDEDLKIFRRFTSVLSLTYRRYKDLREAEAQTRQAQIEAAMEKVRARALAMQKPSELVEVAKVLRFEMGLLGVEELETSSIYIHDKNYNHTECWYALKDSHHPEKELISDHFYLNLEDSWVGREMLKFYASGDDRISIPMQGENRKEWINYCNKLSPVIKGYYGDVIPERTYHLYKFSHGAIGAASPGDISVESWNLLKRATAVFSLAYTRFLDLQNAEAQAAEAVRRASLDRVRAEIASMRTTADLDRITPLIWNELITLGVPFIRCGVFIMDEQHQLIHTFLSSPEGKAIAAFHLPVNVSEAMHQVFTHWQKNEIYKDHWDEQAIMAWTQTLIEQGAITSTEKYLTDHPPANLFMHFIPFLQGMLYVGNEAPLNNDEIHLVQSLSGSFSTAYARYEDFNKLESAKKQVDHTLAELKQTQAQLVQAEKMASLGELTAGIAHEIQNPLNFVNNFSEVNAELIIELEQEVEKGNLEEAKAIAKDIRENEQKINHHGKRADAIVKGMLQHSKNNTGTREPVHINALINEYLQLAYHGLKARDKSFKASFQTNFDVALPVISIIPQDIGRVLLNLFANAFYAVNEKCISNGSQGTGSNSFNPVVNVSSEKRGDKAVITVNDNGNGIPRKFIDKIFQPFFTTKPTGQGTGLGLSLAYDIIKAHGGELAVASNEGEGATFTIVLPLK